jgi:hypothetical protein
MTEEEWDTCTFPRRMLKHLLREARGEEWLVPEHTYLIELIPRRWRLVVAAFLRRLPPRRGPYGTTIERLERMADSSADAIDWRNEWREHHRFGWERYRDYAMITILRADHVVSGAGWCRVSISRSGAAKFRGVERARMRLAILAEEELAQSQLIRCIFGNPFRPVAFAPEWRTPTAVALADAIYADRAFDRLPVLADALEEAGCDNLEVLAHCRGPGPHARGCWVVDLILGKS